MESKMFKNYEAFYSMVLVCTGLTNTLGDEADKDCEAAIEFVGEAYKLDKEFIDEAKRVIIDELCSIGTDSDINAFYSLCESKSISKEEEALLTVKVDAIHAIQGAVARTMYEEWFSYTMRKTYFPTIRHSEIATAATSGILILNLIAGIADYLGIGTEKRTEGAIQRLRQCAFWGSLPAIHMLAMVLAKEGNDKAPVYADLVKLLPLLQEGYTVLPQNLGQEVCKEAKQLFALISSIRHDIILDFDMYKIDYTFVEIMVMDEIDYYTKLESINNYKDGSWKNLSNPASNPKIKIGFVLEEEDK